MTDTDEVAVLKAALLKADPNYLRNLDWRDRFMAGETLRQIAETYHVNPSTVFRQLRRMDVDTSANKPKTRHTGLLAWALDGSPNG